jgi:hypothetical protein
MDLTVLHSLGYINKLLIRVFLTMYRVMEYLLLIFIQADLAGSVVGLLVLDSVRRTGAPWLHPLLRWRLIIWVRSYNQNLWIRHLSGGAAYLPR